MKYISQKFFILSGLVLLLQSCISKKDIIYFQDFQKIEGTQVEKSPTIIQSGDKISISVLSKDPLAAEKFNLGALKVTTDEAEESVSSYYEVDETGFIVFPELDAVKIGGKSIQEAQTFLSSRLSQYFKGYAPPVRINIQNFKFTVLGSIRAPGNYEVAENSINVIQAIAEAGDIPEVSEKTEIKVIRTENGVKKTAILDFTSIDIVNSPFYWLVQGDVLVVKPSKYTVQQAVIGPYAQMAISLGLSIISAAVLIGLRNN